MVRFLIAALAFLAAPLLVAAQPLYGPLQIQNNLSEFNQSGTTSTAQTNLLGSTVSLGGPLTTAGAFGLTLTTTGTTNITLPTSGTIYAGQGLIGVQTFCSSGCAHTTGVYTPDAGTLQVIVAVQGSGGGTGGCVATGAGQICATGGAGAGAFEEALFTSGFSGVTVTVNAGGAAGSPGNPGVSGPTASFGTLLACPGGNPLTTPLPQTAPATWTAVSGSGGASGLCTLTGGTFISSLSGATGDEAYASGSGVNQVQSGAGAASAMGIPLAAQTTTTSSNGLTGKGYGEGATGGVSIASQAAWTGGTGGQGIVIIYEFN
jgi:hypothetical protein